MFDNLKHFSTSKKQKQKDKCWFTEEYKKWKTWSVIKQLPNSHYILWLNGCNCHFFRHKNMKAKSNTTFLIISFSVWNVVRVLIFKVIFLVLDFFLWSWLAMNPREPSKTSLLKSSFQTKKQAKLKMWKYHVFWSEIIRKVSYLAARKRTQLTAR